MTKKPVIALMGEFSAGKSTLSNLLLGEGRSPVRVTATQLPPLWFSHGPEAMVAVGHDGTERGIGPDDLAAVKVAEVRHVRISLGSGLLRSLDLVDMPGNSDPNMSAEVWRALVPEMDGAIWCTHATQAWRQSEAAAWEEMPETLRRSSLLLLTRWDKLLTERDRTRVLRRVSAEAGASFRGVLPISLTGALGAGEDEARWIESGARDFQAALAALVAALGGVPPAESRPVPRAQVPAGGGGASLAEPCPAEAGSGVDLGAIVTRLAAEAPAGAAAAEERLAAAARPVVPRPVSRPAMQTPRPVTRPVTRPAPAETGAAPERSADPRPGAGGADAALPPNVIRIQPRRVSLGSAPRSARPR